MQAAYLAALLLSFLGVGILDRRVGARVTASAPGRRGLLRGIVAVLVVFLVFDYVGASRGWFATRPDRVVALFGPGIPLEEPVLLAFLAFLSIVTFAALEARRRA